MLTVKVTTVGSSAGIVLPKEALTRLNISKGDVLHLTETADGYMLTPYDPEFEAQMQAAEDGMAQYRNTLRALAK